MAKVLVVPPRKWATDALPAGYSGRTQADRIVDAEKFPLQLHRHRLGKGESLRVGPMAVDCVAYVWHGGIEAGGVELACGSSFIVEKGEKLEVSATAEATDLLTFAASDAEGRGGLGGHVHLLPVERVPRGDDVSGGLGIGGALHADSACPTCDVWLHENHFPGTEAPDFRKEPTGVHSHTEDEIIFIIDGSIRLGNAMFEEGTAIAIAADTFYTFTPGPKGMSFINFRAGMPGEVKLATGGSMDETQFWKDCLPRPEYLEPAL